MNDPSALILLACQIALVLLLAALGLATIRVVAGPSLADRVLGLDLLVTLAIGLIAVIALITGQSVYVDIGLALALVGFLATIAFARFMASRAGPGDPGGHRWPGLPGGHRPVASGPAKPGNKGQARATKPKGRRNA